LLGLKVKNEEILATLFHPIKIFISENSLVLARIKIQ